MQCYLAAGIYAGQMPWRVRMWCLGVPGFHDAKGMDDFLHSGELWMGWFGRLATGWTISRHGMGWMASRNLRAKRHQGVLQCVSYRNPISSFPSFVQRFWESHSIQASHSTCTSTADVLSNQWYWMRCEDQANGCNFIIHFSDSKVYTAVRLRPRVLGCDSKVVRLGIVPQKDWNLLMLNLDSTSTYKLSQIHISFPI
jgi:hypothetical protein